MQLHMYIITYSSYCQWAHTDLFVVAVGEAWMIQPAVEEHVENENLHQL